VKLLEKQFIFAQNVSELLNYVHLQGFNVTLAEAYRTPEQAALNAKSGKGIANSLHCKRLAIDLNLFDGLGNWLQDSDDHKPFGEYWETLHPANKWGGRFTKPDGNHYQMDE
jgi:hypothetical protein